ncbi:MAG TPA: hypothetical protein VI197_23950 [Polyangiaceae bacterium]
MNDDTVLVDEPQLLEFRLFVKNKVFDAENLATVRYTLPSIYDPFDGASENVYAIDLDHELMATKNYVYHLDRYDVVAPTLRLDPDQVFFDVDGALWLLSASRHKLEKQEVRR